MKSVRSWRFGANECSGLSPRWSIQLSKLFKTTYMRLLNTFSATLSLYRNLRSLHLEALIIDASFRQSLSELPRLENLALRSCDIVERNGFAMKLRSFAISERTLLQRDIPRPREISRQPLTMMSPESLYALYLDSPAKTAPLLAGFGHAQFPHLVVLSIEHVSQLDILLDFLARCPKLEALTITTVCPDLIASLPRYTLSPNTTPALRDLTVRAEILSLFTLNRPIGAVTILNEPASVPLLSLSIPETTPTPDLLTGITIHSGSSGPPPPPSVKRRCPVLCDADVFNNIPKDNLSDAEQDESPSIVIVQIPQKPDLPLSSTKLHQVLHWIFDGTASLPQEIEILRLIWDENLPSFVWAKFSVVEQQEIVAKLSHLYPHLREVRIGYSDSVWNREGAVWRKCGTDSYMQVV
ncbi:F-box domain-containing protein [Mycena sanguinolenta]|uniref:F-box domain-containing protein n=1 Tax=Mycena sanguinolenta TaxID=230812 RepID=A0A8H6ZHG0_9AGAR|nr:F-box domain-containing protein [Mycena sanguinolenta]